MKISFKTLALAALMAASALTAGAQSRMKFNSNGEFKVVQFTDMHLANNAERNDVVKSMIRELVTSERPDLVVFTGDNTIVDQVPQLWGEISALLTELHTPFTAVLGNHDDEHAVKRPDIAAIIARQPSAVAGQPAKGVKGQCNRVIEIMGKNPKVPAAAIYCFDSNAYSTHPEVKGYGWIDRTQIDWYDTQSRRMARLNGGKPVPALAFQHIPLPEHLAAWETDTLRLGTKTEGVCAPALNTGMFSHILENGDIMGLFVGHDHVNDYTARLSGVVLGYGRASGGRNTYGDYTPGGRVYLLREGTPGFETWVREKGNPNQLYHGKY